MTDDSADPTPVAGPARSADLVLAHVHLRLGALALARAELETLAGRDGLDDDGLVDLAEARWRTGDVSGAGEAAAAVLGDGDDGPLIALVVAAEAAILRGRPTEARRYATQAMERVDGATIDDIFAGMPRGPVWPADATTLVPPSPTLFDEPRRAGSTRARTSAPTVTGHPDTPIVTGGPAASTVTATSEPATIALWAALEAEPEVVHADQPTPTTAEPELPSGDDALRSGRGSIERGDLTAAAVDLALALRLTPALAPAVLDAIDGRIDRELAFVRGDAYRLVGREREARRAYADALRPATPPEITTDPPQEGDPA